MGNKADDLDPVNNLRGHYTKQTVQIIAIIPWIQTCFFIFFSKAFSPLYLISHVGAFQHGIINRHRYM